MNHNTPSLPVVVDQEPKQENTDYTAPEMFAVGQTVDLIQGAQWRGPLDHPSSWPVWSL